MARERQVKTPGRSPRRKARADEHGGERKVVTALCYDLVGSTDLFHQLDIEDYQELIEAFQQAARQAIASHSGVIRVEAGDGGVALFPTELDARDAASLAIRAGLAVIGACKRLGHETGWELRVRIGIATSVALVQAAPGESEPVTGAALALAARLETIAAPDSVLVSDRTKMLAGRSHAFVHEGARDLKGFLEPETVWRALGHKTEVDRFYAFGRLGSAFIGRASELAAVVNAWKNVRAGRGEILAIEGEAGIGKSRLLHEIRKLTRNERAKSFLFQCSPGGGRSPLHPLLHSFSGQGSSAGSHLTAETVAERFGRQGICDAEVVEVFAFLLGVAASDAPTFGREPKIIREKARRAISTSLAAVCRNGPVVLAVEDIHWIDPTSQDLLGEAARVVPHFPVLLVTTARPGAPADWLEGAAHTRLALAPLAPEETRLALESIWPDHRRATLPDLLEVTERISGGIPLFIEEICQWVSEGRADAMKISDTSSPTHTSTFEGILEERLRNLGAAREVARAAAVTGARFTLPLLRELLPDFGKRALSTAAATLCEAGFLTRVRAAGLPAYAFRHALIQETIYKAVLRKQRQALHRRLFGIVSQSPDIAPWMDDGALAEQAEHAGLPESAAELFIAAGRESSRRSAMIEACHHLEHALTLCPQIGEGAAVDALQLSALTALGPILTGLVGQNSPPARKLYEDGVAIARRQPREQQSQWFPIYWGWWLTGADFLTMHDRALEVQAMLSGVDDPEINLQVQHCIWAIDFNLGWHRETQSAIRKGLALYSERSAEVARTLYGGHDAKVCGLGQLALSLWLTGERKASDEALAEMADFVEYISHVPSTAHALDTEAVSAFYRDDYRRLEAVSGKMAAFAEEHAMQSLRGLSLLFGGWAMAHRSDLERGHDTFRQGLSLLRDLGTVADLPIYLYMHATMLGQAGGYEEAIAVATNAIREARETGHAYWLAELYRCRAVLMARGNKRESLVAADLHTAQTIAENQRAIALLQRTEDSIRELGLGNVR